MEAAKILPKKLEACKELLTRIEQHEDAAAFLKPLVATDHGVTTEEYEKNVKQPMDLSTIRKKLDLEPGKTAAYTNVSGFSKDVNRIFSNVVKVWSPGDEIADAARRLQAWWVDEWTALVPVLMNMKLEDEPKSQDDAPVECEDAVAAATMATNERSEDFQEQIGMPDEENMRSWSHHYDVSSCDDPIFRAAMRGTDAVSFIFGLEVTWDLIQQRQQQEEDEIAMKMMEEANEEDFLQQQNDEAEEEDSDGGNEEGSADNAAPTKKKGKSKTPAKKDNKKVATKANAHSTGDSEDESEDDGSDTEMNDFIVDDEGDDNGGNESASGSGDSEPEGGDDDSSSSDEESIAEKHDADEEESRQPDEPMMEEKEDEEKVAVQSNNEVGSPSESSSRSVSSEGEGQNQSQIQSSQEEPGEAATPPKKKRKSDTSTPPTSGDSSGSSSESSESSSPEESQQSQPPAQAEPVDEEMEEDEDDSPAVPEEPADNGPVYDVELANGSWICSTCTCQNARRARKCIACQKARVRNDEEHYQRTSI